jgi:hypothetical protein
MRWTATAAMGVVCGLLIIGWAGARVALGAQETWVGMISDSTCGGDHGGEVDVKECTAKCIRNGDKYVLATNGGTKVIAISNQSFPALPERAGETVKVTGELRDGAIDISKIEGQ